MNRFAYLRDPLFLVAAAGYILNRGVLKPLLPIRFLHTHLNDLLLIPGALPPVLWVQRALRLRNHDEAPLWSEMLFHALVWSVICEVLGPRWFHHGVADAWDVVAYLAGGVLACLWWHFYSRPTSAPSS